MTLDDFTKPIPQALLNIEDKRRSNLFAWRGQFSPQLVECILAAYCLPDSVVLDPFAGSGTVLYEAARMRLSAFGYEINPSAWSFSKLYEFANAPYAERDRAIGELWARIKLEFPLILFSEQEIAIQDIEEKVIRIGESLTDRGKILFNALVCVLDVFSHRITNYFVHSKLATLAKLVRSLPYSDQQIKADLQDARRLPLERESVDFAVTSPPYINVFNYHHNYRRSVEVLGWDSLRVARSEIGSNRANRGNRFLTVTQYSIDMTKALQELARVLRPSGRAVVILGHQSRVLGAAFYNSHMVEQIACRSQMFDVVLRQQRLFSNRFGEVIREDILNLQRRTYRDDEQLATTLGRDVSREALSAAQATVPRRNLALLLAAISRVDETAGTPVFDSLAYATYQRRAEVMMVKEREVAHEH